MDYKIILRNTSNNTRTVKFGLSWTMYFFTFIVLLYRGHILYAFCSILYNVVVTFIAAIIIDTSYSYGSNIMEKFIIIHCIFYLPFLIFGNKISVLQYIKDGYKIVEPDKEKIARIQLRWNISDDSFLNDKEEKTTDLNSEQEKTVDLNSGQEKTVNLNSEQEKTVNLDNKDEKKAEHVIESREVKRPSAFKIPGKHGRGARPY